MSYHHLDTLPVSVSLCISVCIFLCWDIYLFPPTWRLYPWFSFFRGHISSIWCLPRWHGETVSDANVVGSVGMVGADRSGQVTLAGRREWEKTILRFQKKDVEWSWVYKIWTTAKFYTFRWDGGRQGECLEGMGRRRWVRGTVPCYCVYPKIKPGLIVIFCSRRSVRLIFRGCFIFSRTKNLHLF